MSKDSLVCIYDFAILPYALGDVLTWNIKRSVIAEDAGLSKIEVLVCADDEVPSVYHQNQYITSSNFETHLLELMPAFSSNPKLLELRVFRSRERMWSALEGRKLNEASKAGVLGYRRVWDRRAKISEVNNYFEQQICSHQDLNDYAARNGSEIPWLSMSRSFLEPVRELKERWNPLGYFVALNFRTRAFDPDADDAEQERDANLAAWMYFLNWAEKVRPDVTFVLLGRTQEKPPVLLELKNVLFPRALGQGLGHELAWIQESDCFLGSSSGFAAMANFLQTPYLITGMNPRACKNYCIEEGTTRLPFSTEGQELMYGAESSDRLQEYLCRTLPLRENVVADDRPESRIVERFPTLRRSGEWGALAFNSVVEEYESLMNQGMFRAAFGVLDIKLRKSVQSKEEEILYLKSRARYYCDVQIYSNAKIELEKLRGMGVEDVETRSLLEEANSQLLLENVDRFIQRNPDVGGAYCGVDLVRARAYEKLGRYEEAFTSVQSHLRGYPEDDSATELEQRIRKRIAEEAQFGGFMFPV